MTVYYCLAIVLIMPIVLALSTIPFRISQQQDIGLQDPRGGAAKLTGAGQRMVYAQYNAWEALVLFTAALFLAISNGITPEALATPALVFVAARITHAVVYVLGIAVLRFLSFFVGFAAILFIVYSALF